MQEATAMPRRVSHVDGQRLAALTKALLSACAPAEQKGSTLSGVGT